MSSKKSKEDLKTRLQASKEAYDKRGFAGSFKMDHISGDTNIRKIDTDDLVDAPSDWNFYGSLSDSKMRELLESIESNGLLHPIVVWEQSQGKYMILAGHNRVKAYRILEEKSGGVDYRKIPALIKGIDEIDEDDAREIIIDTNWVQRVLSAVEKSKSIVEKYAVLEKKKKSGMGRIRDIIAKEYEVTGRLVDEYRRLGNLRDEIKDMVSDNRLSMTSASKLGLFDKTTQSWIVEKFGDKLSRKYTKQLRSGMDRDEIEGIFEYRDTEDKAKVVVSLDKQLADKYAKLNTEKKQEVLKALEIIIQELN